MKRGLLERSNLFTAMLVPGLALLSWQNLGARAALAVEGDAEPANGEAITDAPVRPVSDPAPRSANFRTNGPAAEVVKMANSGVQEEVILAYVNRSASTFNLSADEIIYLKDIGLSGSVVTAMLKRDEQVRQDLARTLAELQSPPSVPAPSQSSETASAAPAYSSDSLTAPAIEVDSGNFYDSLAPYGNWVDIEGYGRCWQPTVARVTADWRPYFDNGNWVYTDAGWYWMSDYSWGWAPFHYGRWFRHNRIGWCWLPDTTWAPSWVCWRYTDDYCGWAPLPPAARFAPGVGLTYHRRLAATGFDFGLSVDFFPFVPWSHFNDHHLRPHLLPPPRAHDIFARTICASPIEGRNRTVVNHGVPPERVASATHTPVRPIALREASGAPPHNGRAEHLEPNGRSLTVYRPPAPSSSPSAHSPVQVGGSRPLRGSGDTGGVMPSSGSNERLGALSSGSVGSRPSPAGTHSIPTAPSRGNNNLIMRGQEVVSAPTPIRHNENSSGNSLVVVGRHDYSRSVPESQHGEPSFPGYQGSSSQSLNRTGAAARAESVSPSVPGSTWSPSSRDNLAPTSERPDNLHRSNFETYRSPGSSVPSAARQPGTFPSYQVPTRTAPEVPRYNSGSSYSPPPRSYSPPPSYSPPSRPTSSDAPRYSAPTPRGGDSRPTPPSPPSNSSSNERRRP